MRGRCVYRCAAQGLFPFGVTYAEAITVEVELGTAECGGWIGGRGGCDWVALFVREGEETGTKTCK